MFNFWDDLNDHYNQLNEKDKRLNKKRHKLYNSFRHPHQIAVYQDFVFNMQGEIKTKERFADNQTAKYSDLNYNNFKKMKKEFL